MKEIAEIEIEECIALTIDKYKVVVCVDNRDIGRIIRMEIIVDEHIRMFMV